MVAMIPTLINGRWTLKLPEHRAARPEWVTGWEKPRWDSVHSNIRPNDIVFDIGSEEMDLTALVASWLGVGGGIVAFEPNPRVWSNGYAIWEANNLLPPLACFPGFADDTTDDAGGEVLRSESWKGWPASAYDSINPAHGFERPESRPDLPHVTLDDFCWNTGLFPDIITMDVEGAELRVVMGAERVLKYRKPLVYVSVHPEMMRDEYGVGVDVFYDYMAGLGYSKQFLAEDHELHFLFYNPAADRLPQDLGATHDA